MKKLFLTLVAIMAVSLTGFARTSLADAYNSLSKLSGMSETKAQKVMVDNNSAIKNMKTASISVSGDDIQAYREKFIFESENLPVRKMIVGANNMRDMAMIYAEPTGYGSYNILIIKGDTESGNFSASYGQTTAAGVKAIKGSQVTMDSQELVIIPQQTNGTESFMSMIK